MKKLHSLIVGGTKGLGRFLVKQWSKEDVVLSVLGRSSSSESDKKLANIHSWAVDISEFKVLKPVLSEVVKKNGKINHLVFFQRYRDKEDQWNGEIDTGLTATKNIIEHLIPEFNPEGEKSIVLVNSIASDFILQDQSAGYHLAKAGQAQLVKYFAVVLGPKNIRINGVAPAIVMKEEAMDFYNKNEALHNLYKKIVPLGRMGLPKDVADLILFLCSSRASYITGQNIVIDGGLSLQSQQSLARKLTSL